jgi:hypothetical protein
MEVKYKYVAGDVSEAESEHEEFHKENCEITPEYRLFVYSALTVR